MHIYRYLLIGQFAAIPLNLIQKTGKAAYLNTGTWSSKAAKEASKYGIVYEIKVDYISNPNNNLDLSLEEDISYFHYCANETVHGIELDFNPQIPYNIPVVADMSSNILTKDIDITKVISSMSIDMLVVNQKQIMFFFYSLV